MEYVIYCRRSSDEASEKQAQSIPDQISRCIEYAEKNGLTIMQKPKDFSDFELPDDIAKEDGDSDIGSRRIYQSTRHLFIVKESETAKIPYKRKKRRKLMTYIKNGKIQGLLSYSPDRQARNILEGGEVINFVDEEMIDLKYTNFHFENTASGKMMLGVWFVFAKQYSDAISENVLRGNDETVGRGKAMGAYKYGYIRDKETGYFKPDGEKFDLMRKAFELKIYEQKSDSNIATWLNDHGWSQERGKNELQATGNKLNKIWKDTFYYGLHVHGENTSDQIEQNPYYKPLITREEYEILADRRDAKKTPIALKQIKDEYEEIRQIPRDMLKSKDNYSLTPNLPNKKRYLSKLYELQKTKPTATLKSVVQPNQIRYGVKQKLSQFCGLEITGQDIDKAVLAKLDTMKVPDTVYNEYVATIKQRIQDTYDQATEEIQVLNLRINGVRSECKKYIDKHMGLERDNLEEEIYQNKKKEYEGKITRLEKERDSISKGERNTYKELEGFLDMTQRAGDYYKRATYVQKAKMCEIFFSNIILEANKKLVITPKPLFEAIFQDKKSNNKKITREGYSFGADDETRTRNQLLGRQGL